MGGQRGKMAQQLPLNKIAKGLNNFKFYREYSTAASGRFQSYFGNHGREGDDWQRIPLKIHKPLKEALHPAEGYLKYSTSDNTSPWLLSHISIPVPNTSASTTYTPSFSLITCAVGSRSRMASMS